MILEIGGEKIYVIKLRLSEAIELRDSLNDLIEKEDMSLHHHVSEFNLSAGKIDSEIIISLYSE